MLIIKWFFLKDKIQDSEFRDTRYKIIEAFFLKSRIQYLASLVIKSQFRNHSLILHFFQQQNITA